MCVINATARSRPVARRVKRKVSAAGSKDQRTKITSAGRKTASASRTGENAIPAIGAKRGVQSKYRYKNSSKRKPLTMKGLFLKPCRVRSRSLLDATRCHSGTYLHDGR